MTSQCAKCPRRCKGRLCPTCELAERETPAEKMEAEDSLSPSDLTIESHAEAIADAREEAEDDD